jgi:hypothetical protein
LTVSKDSLTTLSAYEFKVIGGFELEAWNNMMAGFGRRYVQLLCLLPG